MTALILDLLSPFLPYIAAAIGAVVLFLTGRASGGAKARQRQAEAQAKADQQAHERMNHAETGDAMSDDDRIDWLHDFAAKHGNGSSKAGGR